MSSSLHSNSTPNMDEENDEIIVELEEENATDPSNEGTQIREKILTSDVWSDMARMRVGDKLVATCNYCKKQYSAESSKGTSHLRKHIRTCVLRKLKISGQKELQYGKNGLDDSANVQIFKFDQERSRMDLARAIIKHNYPFSIVEHEYFEISLNNLQPNFKLVSRNTIRAEVVNIYKEEKEKLYNWLDNFSGKISLTTDMWTSDHSNFAYACLTAHYITDGWELKKKILAFRSIPYPQDGETLFRFISDIILEWNIDKKLLSMVVDNASSNDPMVRHLKSWLLGKCSINLGGELFHVRCSAHILNLIVQDGLSIISGLLQNIRNTLKYLKKSPSANQKFENAFSQCKLKNKKRVSMDVSNRWNSTFFYA